MTTIYDIYSTVALSYLFYTVIQLAIQFKTMMDMVECLQDEVDELQMEQSNSSESVTKHISDICSLKKQCALQIECITRLQTQLQLTNQSLNHKIDDCDADISELKWHSHDVNNMSVEVAVEECNDNIDILHNNIVKLRDVFDLTRNEIIFLQNEIAELKSDNYNSHQFIPSSMKRDMAQSSSRFTFPELIQHEINTELHSEHGSMGMLKKEYLGIDPFTGQALQANVISITEPST